jgi:O-antigen ligase
VEKMPVKSIAGKINFFLLCLLSAFPILPFKLAPIVIGAWCVSCLFVFDLSAFRKKKKLTLLVVFILPYVLHLASLAANPRDGELWFIIEKKMALFFVPVFVFFSARNLHRERMGTVFNVYIASALVSALMANLNIILKKTEIFSLTGDEFSYAYRTALEDFSGFHPTYFAMAMLFGSLLLIWSLLSGFRSTLYGPVVYRTIVAGILLGAGMLAGARTPLAAFGISSLILLAGYWSMVKKQAWIAAAFGALLVLIFFLSPLRNRSLEFAGLKSNNIRVDEKNTLNIRTGIYNCSLTLIKDNWFTGVGPGEVQRKLNQCYEQYATNVYKLNNYNTHNEYLNHWLSFGIAGFLSFLMIFFMPAYIGLQKKQFIYPLFLLFMFICCMTENLLARQTGVIFYTFFNSLMAFTGDPPLIINKTKEAESLEQLRSS